MEKRTTVLRDRAPACRSSLSLGDDTGVVLDLMSARTGREFRQSDLFESQRNLYSSDLFRIATVGVDSSRFEYGTDSVPVVVEVAESRRYRVRAGAGYGTNDCLRGSAGLAVRNFMGRGRILDITTRVSKVGVGTPADWGFEDGICGELRNDSRVRPRAEIIPVVIEPLSPKGLPIATTVWPTFS